MNQPSGDDCPYCPATVVADASVLFVHGIGRQRPGHTLTGFAEPLLSFAQAVRGRPEPDGTITGVRRLARHEPARALVAGRTRLLRAIWGTSRQVTTSAWPVHEIWEVTSAGGDGVTSRRWLLAESCWARSFALPHPARFAASLLLVIPWLGMYQMGTSWYGWLRDVLQPTSTISHRRRLPMIALAGSAAYLGFAPRLLATIGALALAPVCAIAGVLPIVRAPVIVLIDFVGDSLAAMGDPAARARMCDTLRADMRWTRRRVHRSGSHLIVAHSQGAMLGRETLAAERPGDDTTFFGLGSGLGLLHGINRALSLRTGLLGWVSATFLTLMLGLLSVAAIISTPQFFLDIATAWRDPYGAGMDRAFAPPSEAEWMVMASIVCNIVGGLALRMSGLTQLIANWRAELRLPRSAVGHWREFSSSYDPVACGVILDGIADLLVQTVNSPFLPVEHGAYRRNPMIQLHILHALAGASGLFLPVEFVRRVRTTSLARERRNLRIARGSTYMIWTASFAGIVWLLLSLGVGGLL
jgi:hypothetical protein